ncbi:cation transporter [Methanobacterium alkalithermotolerans]|uniref:Cation transporter n=2 Tax=Methanobacterium alkalithermotolerans TaxID=2731220 RepID=A0A8T8KCA2_9EURY|nr:cation transporter [Methanobacterium alkalithermotolerans]RJS49687.1 MAG: cation-efflux pump [Methanobacterium sp.]
MTMNSKNYYSRVRNILIIILFLNLGVSLTKLGYGWYTNSLSIVSDGFHSLFDGISNVIGIVGIIIASRPPDSEHPYGHVKFETLASLGIAIILFFTCFEIFKSAVERLFDPTVPEISMVSFIIIGITICINIVISWFENREGKRLGSSILVADSLHTRSDVYGSVAVILGFIAIKMGFVIADSIVAILIALLIARTGISIIKSSSDVLLDKAPLESKDIKKIVNALEEVKDCHKIRTRGPKSSIYVDLHIELEGCLSLDEAHDISHKVEETLKNSIEGVKDVTVHVDPCNE